MIHLLKCEFKKFKNTYINSLSFLGMLSPILLVLLMFLIKKNDFIKSGNYNWNTFNSQLSMFFIFLVGPIITSFIAVFSVYYEYQEKTMKNMVSSPHNRIKIILVKVLYVSVLVVLQYVFVAIVNVLCAKLLGFDFTMAQLWRNSCQIVLAGLTTVILVPFMIFITTLFRTFIPAMIIAVAGTISNVLLLNWEKSYLSPWANPANISLIVTKQLKMDMIYPVLSTCAYFLVFMVFAVVYFHRADQNT